MSNKSIIFAISSIIILQLAISLLQSHEEKQSSDKQIVDYFQKSILHKEHLSTQYFKDRDNIDLLNKNEITILTYKNNNIISWSNNSICISNDTKNTIDSKRYGKIGNSWYLIKKLNNTYALSLIKRDYPNTNRHLKNVFSNKLNAFPDVKISDNTNSYKHIISDSEGNEIMSIDTHCCHNYHSYWTIILFTLQLLILLLFSILGVQHSEKKFSIFALAVFLAILRMLIIDTNIFTSILDNHFLNICINESYLLSHFIIDTLLISSFLISLSNTRTNISNNKTSLIICYLIFGITIIFSVCTFMINELSNIIDNTDISLSLSRWNFVNTSSYLIYVSIALGSYSVCLVTQKLLTCTYQKSRFILLVPIYVVLTLIIGIIFNHFFDHSLYSILLTSIIVLFNILLLRVKRHELLRIIFILQLFTVATCIVHFINTNSIKQIVKEQVNFANELAIEKDTITEKRLVTLSSKIELLLKAEKKEELSDSILKTCEKLIGKRYYYGITECTEDDIISFDTDTIEYKCFEFFERKINKTKKIENSHFRYEDNFDGKINYIGIFSKGGTRYYLEIFSKAKNEGTGYPEILESISQNTIDGFSWAKYSDCKLLISSGTYNFQNKLKQQKDSVIYINGNIIYNHKIKNNNILVFAESKLTPHKILNIPYLFIILCLIAFTPWMIKSLKRDKNSFKSFNSKIRNRFTVSIIIFFLTIGTASTYYSIIRFEDSQEKRITNLLKTLVRRLETNEINTNSLSNISDILQTDINIFNSKGFLLASSRPEIYNKFIASELINPKALQKTKTKTIVFENESITNMNYISVYAPLTNKIRGEQLIINIPYFSESTQFNEEVSNLLISGFNIFIFISLIAIVISIYLSDKITKPLNIIYLRFKEMELTKENKPIHYTENNELGRLVKEYNSTVEKLSDSAEKLAKGERETAWREMAKQIAHEIKNPLTPMKLSIQHLQLNKDFSSDKWNRQFGKTCKVLLEQIDNLANIASSFSDFSNISMTKAERVNIPNLLEGIKDLFSDKNNIKLVFTDKQIETFSPTNQLRRAFINIVKNALHSMETVDNKNLEISIKKEDKYALIAFKDHGKGISEEIQERLFEPHFTTKSSGMGLGLAITKEIIINSKGKIWFESEKEKGTTFYIKLPLYF